MINNNMIVYLLACSQPESTFHIEQIQVSFEADLSDQGTVQGSASVECTPFRIGCSECFQVSCPSLDIDLYSIMPDGTEDIFEETIQIKDFGLIWRETDILSQDFNDLKPSSGFADFFPFTHPEGFVTNFDPAIVIENSNTRIDLLWVNPRTDLPGKMELSLEALYVWN